MEKKRMLIGDRPIEKLCLEHYIESLKNKIKYQYDYDCFFVIADIHALTTNSSKEDIDLIAENSRNLVLDYLSCGIDPAGKTIYLQSAVHEIFEINSLLCNMVSIPRLQRIRDISKLTDSCELTCSILEYPVMQASDILMTKANMVPVEKGHEAHVELAREIARKFNSMYSEIFPIPDILISEIPHLSGAGSHIVMSKLQENTIFLSDDAKAVEKKVMNLYADPERSSSYIPGKVDGNPVFIYHDMFNPNKTEVQDLKDRYRAGKVGDIEVKQKLVKAINAFMVPIRERREEYQSQKWFIEECIYDGTLKMREEAKKTLLDMKKAMGLSGVWNKISRKAEEVKKKKI